ncbi:MAG: helix-turn-helix transcriptional regulator [Chloroflexota bacterium]
MPRERPIDRANRAADAMLVRAGGELRDGRLDRGLSIDAASAAAGISNAEWSRIERHRSPRVPLVTLVRCGAVVGLDVSVRLFPGGPPVRDAAHLALLGVLRERLHPSLRWATEVPLPIAGDQRAWDATITGPNWTVGVEAETRPRDAQALHRRLGLKLRDARASSMILLLRDSRATRVFLREAADEIMPSFPVAGRRALGLLGAGISPGGSSIVMVPVPLRVPGRHTPGV